MKPSTRQYLLPLAVFAILLGFLAIGLRLDPREIPSPLIDKAAPAFKLPTLAAPGQTLSPQDLRGKVWLLNVWASWCVACRTEHPVLVELAKAGTVPVYGLNYKDKRDAALGWLAQLPGKRPHFLARAELARDHPAAPERPGQQHRGQHGERGGHDRDRAHVRRTLLRPRVTRSPEKPWSPPAPAGVGPDSACRSAPARRRAPSAGSRPRSSR